MHRILFFSQNWWHDGCDGHGVYDGLMGLMAMVAMVAMLVGWAR